MPNNNNSNIDKTLEDTMEASDAPQFTSPSDQSSPIEIMISKFEPLRKESLPSDQAQNLEKVDTLVQQYEQGDVRESQVLEALQNILEQFRQNGLLK